MSILHESIHQRLHGATVHGRTATTDQFGEPFSVEIQRLERGAGLHDWTLHVVARRGGKQHDAVVKLRIQWAGSTPVVTLIESDEPGTKKIAGKILIYDGQFAGVVQLDGVETFQFGTIEHDEATPKKPRYVIERSSEFLREWWTGEEWTDDAQRAHWYVREPDAPKESGDEQAHSVFYAKGIVGTG